MQGHGERDVSPTKAAGIIGHPDRRIRTEPYLTPCKNKCLLLLVFWYHIYEIIAKSNVKKLFPCAFFQGIYSLGSFKCLIHFEMLLVYGVR